MPLRQHFSVHTSHESQTRQVCVDRQVVDKLPDNLQTRTRAIAAREMPSHTSSSTIHNAGGNNLSAKCLDRLLLHDTQINVRRRNHPQQSTTQRRTQLALKRDTRALLTSAMVMEKSQTLECLTSNSGLCAQPRRLWHHCRDN